MLMGGSNKASPRDVGHAIEAMPVARSGREAAECWTSTAADVEAWLKTARPGDLFVYAKGPNLIQGAAAALVGHLHRAGEVCPQLRREKTTGSLEYVCIRNRVRVSTRRAPVCDEHMMSVLLAVQSAAEAGQRCPSDADIAGTVDLSPDQVKWQLKKLEDSRFIERRTVRAGGEQRFRIVRVTATGCETAGPSK